MKKFLVAVLLMVGMSSASAMNDNQQMAFDCYGDHDMNVYFINENGLIESYPILDYISFSDEDGDK